jgi:hypothetical protein
MEEQVTRMKEMKNIQKNKQTPWSESASELYQPSDRRQLLRIKGATWSA